MKIKSVVYILPRLIGVVIVLSGSLFAADNSGYYVAADGNDADPGTMKRPWATLEKALVVVKPGETVYVRGGKYQCNKTIMLLNSGEQGKPIRIWPMGLRNPYSISSRAEDLQLKVLIGI